MAKKQSKFGWVSSVVLIILVGVVAVVAYKQIFLVGRITSNIPEQRLTQGLQLCFQENLTPSMLKKELTTLQQSGGANFMGNFGSVFSSVFDQLSGVMVETRIDKNYLTEIKVLKIQDLLGENAEVRITGSVDVVSKVPVIGDFPARKDYQTTLIKRGEAYHFNGLAVKKPDSAQWDQWSCVQDL